MNEIINNILTRRSVRSFNSKKIEKEKLDLIMKSAIYAPSARNFQTWKFAVIQDKAIISSLAKIIKEALNRDEGYNFYNPDVMILCANKLDNKNGLADCACALQNIFLAAHSLSIGSVWINQFKDAKDDPELKKLLLQLGIHEDYAVWGAAALGYYDDEPTQVEKNENVITWIL
ncbi:MAG: nitroreductase [Clostridia bacterium]|nr:nitroreductase [Clostridia bacterium]